MVKAVSYLPSGPSYKARIFLKLIEAQRAILDALAPGAQIRIHSSFSEVAAQVVSPGAGVQLVGFAWKPIFRMGLQSYLGGDYLFMAVDL